MAWGDVSRTGAPDELFTGFRAESIDLDGVAIACWYGGDGPPLLLLHGYPQSHVMWHQVAPRLAERFTVVCPDLRGYGDSAKPASDETHASYSKRMMAADQLGVMAALELQPFAVVGHDRGARVALRLALDAPSTVTRVALIDIVPTAEMYATVTQPRATSAWRYFFLIQPFDLPERLIAGDPDGYLRWTLDEWCGTPGALSDAALAEYRRCFTPTMVHATCEDYRAGATIDLRHDRDDATARLECPVLVL